MRDLTSDQALIDAFTAMMPMRGSKKRVATSGGTPAKPATDRLVKLLLDNAKRHPLWNGNWRVETNTNGEPFPSQSEADFALLGSIVRDAEYKMLPAEQAEHVALQVFEQSGLYRPEKRQRVQTQDLPNLLMDYSPRWGFSHTDSGVEAVGSATPTLGHGRIGFSSTPPVPRDYVHQGLILAGKTCVLAGFGGVSKTMYAMMLAAHVALGRGMFGKSTKEGCALLILGEEDQEEIDRRFNAIVTKCQFTQGEVDLINDRVRAHPLIGLDGRLSKHQKGASEPTGFTDEIIRVVKALASETGLPVNLVVLDHAGIIHGGDFNAREDVVQTMTQVGQVSQQTGAAAMVLAHSPKKAADKEEPDQSNITGSTAWVDMARAAFVLRTMNDEEAKGFNVSRDQTARFVSLNVVKNNYGPTGDKFWLERVMVPGHDVSVLEVVNPYQPAAANAPNSVHAKVKGHVAANPGRFTKTKLRDQCFGKNGPFGLSKNKLESIIDDLIDSGDLRQVSPTPQQRETYGHRRGGVKVLEAVNVRP